MGGLSTDTEASQGEPTQNAVLWALESGYRHIDTAARYGNEKDIGIGVIQSGIPRDQIFITTKIWDAGYESTLMTAETSLSKLQTSYIDLLLIHSPNPGPQKRIETYRALQELVKRGTVRSIGVSNYNVKHLKELMDANPEIMPVINQLEVHPWNNRKEIISYCTEHKIIVEAFSPLTRGKKFKDPVLVKITEKYNKSPAHVLIRWCLQNNFVVLPKSIKQTHINDNTNVYDFVIDEEDMNILNNLNENFVAAGWDPSNAD
ncbi:2034_t:CDS:2 [Gigaspora margarita]|uniref:2034_t:CDS:1 n=1 Tax=Gigaspora margarita TaxID=4874 RepID=A0ABM8W1V6_GIGMA|nr:2034_t:CDS:2 [Gigaspora margarita]